MHPHPIPARPWRSPRRRLLIAILRQTAIFVGVAALIAFASPCSPFSLWGHGHCPADIGQPRPDVRQTQP